MRLWPIGRDICAAFAPQCIGGGAPDAPAVKPNGFLFFRRIRNIQKRDVEGAVPYEKGFDRNRAPAAASPQRGLFPYHSWMYWARVSMRVAMFTGLAMWAVKPASSARRLSSAKASAVMAMIGSWERTGSSMARIARVAV